MALAERTHTAPGEDLTQAEMDPKRARLLLHGEEDHRFKAIIMEPIDEFYVLLDARTAGATSLPKPIPAAARPGAQRFNDSIR